MFKWLRSIVTLALLACHLQPQASEIKRNFAVCGLTTDAIYSSQVMSVRARSFNLTSGIFRLRPRTAMIFVPAEYFQPDMGKDLSRAYPKVRRLYEQISREASGFIRENETEFVTTQIAAFAHQAAIWEIYREKGGKPPAAIIGFSLGMTAALHVCSVVTLQAAIELVIRGSRFVEAASHALDLPIGAHDPRLEKYQGDEWHQYQEFFERLRHTLKRPQRPLYSGLQPGRRLDSVDAIFNEIRRSPFGLAPWEECLHHLDRLSMNAFIQVGARDAGILEKQKQAGLLGRHSRLSSLSYLADFPRHWRFDLTLLFISSYLADIGFGIYLFAQPYVLGPLRDANFFLNAEQAVYGGATALFLLIGMILGDRSTKKLFVGVVFIRALPALVLGTFTAVSGPPGPWGVIAFSAAAGLGQGLISPIFQRMISAIMEDVSDETKELVPAVNRSKFALGRMSGAYLAAPLVAWLGISSAYFIYMATLFSVVAAIVIIRTPLTPKETHGQRLSLRQIRNEWEISVKEAVSAFRADRHAVLLFLMMAAAACFGNPLFSLLKSFSLPLQYAQSWHHGGAFLSGLVWLGLAGILPRRWVRSLSWQMVIGLGASVALFAVLPSGPWRWAMIGLAGFCNEWLFIVAIRFIQGGIKNSFAARASGIMYFLPAVASLGGGFMAGSLANWVLGPVGTLIFCGLTLMAGGWVISRIYRIDFVDLWPSGIWARESNGHVGCLKATAA